MDVRMPDGTTITNVPDNITKADLLSKYSKSQPPAETGPGAPVSFASGFNKTVAGLVGLPVDTAENVINLGKAGFGTAATALGRPDLAPDITHGSPGGSRSIEELMAKLKIGTNIPENAPLLDKLAYGAGKGTAASIGGPTTVTGAATGAGVGAVLGTSGAAAKAAFPDSPNAEMLGTLAPAAALGGASQLFAAATKNTLTPEQALATNFAKETGAPMAARDVGGKAAKVAQNASELPLLSQIKNQGEARKITQKIYDEMAVQTAGEKPVEEVALRGQQFFKNILASQKDEGVTAFENFQKAVGKDTTVPLTNTQASIDEAMAALQRTAQTGPLYKYLKKIKTGLSDGSARTLDEVEKIRKTIGKKASTGKDMTHDEAGMVKDAIMKDYEDLGTNIGVDLKGMNEQARAEWMKFQELRKIPGVERLAKETGVPGAPAGTNNWFRELFTQGNAKALGIIREKDPAMFDEMSATYLGNVFSKFRKPSQTGFGMMLDGDGLRKYFIDNRQTLEAVLGKDKTKSLDGFTAYVKYASPTVARAEQRAAVLDNPMTTLIRGGSEMAATSAMPAVMIPTEIAAYRLARSLNNPNSALFKVFTEGYNSTNSGLKIGGKLVTLDAARGGK